MAEEQTAKEKLNGMSFMLFFLGVLLLWFSKFLGCGVMLVAITVSVVAYALKK